jgi:hypothetical protein
LQAAAVAEFHALPLAAPLIAWALWAVEDRRWGEFVAAGLLLAGVQEGMALLTATLGLYAAIREWGRGKAQVGARPISNTPYPVFVGPGIFLFGLAWFYVATFVIIPHYAALAYGLGETPYAARFGALGDSFGDVLKSWVTQPLTVLRIAAEPLRVRYLAGLLWPTAFLALLGPEILLLGAPLLLANLLSGFPFQYSGELHYSAPLVPFFIVAALFGFERLMREIVRSQGAGGRRQESGEKRLTPDRWRLILTSGVLLVGLGYQTAAGYLPFGREFGRQGWPKVTAHHRLLGRFAAQIPPDAPLSVTTGLYPHLSHRQRIYQFPQMGAATWALADVTGATDRHPNDVRDVIVSLLGCGWGVVDAADGYLLLAQGQGSATIPDSFYDFARAPVAEPQHPIDMTFDGQLRLLGYDVLDDVKWRRTSLRFYWQAVAPLPADTAIIYQALTPAGGVADDTAARAMPALVWYPPSRWRVGETLVTQSLPWYLPRDWAPQVAVTFAAGRAGPVGAWLGPGWSRRDGALVPLDAPTRVFPLDMAFSGLGWSVRLTGWAAPVTAAPGKSLPVVLRWQAAGPAARDLTVFLQLRDRGGKTVGSGDATPTWFAPMPTTSWPVGSGARWDAHLVAVPAALPTGNYDLVAGWYDWQTGERLRARDEGGNLIGDEFVLGQVMAHPLAGPRPDLACLVAADSCASLE